MYGLALKEKGQIDQASVQFGFVLDKRPNDVNALASLAKMCKSKGKAV